MSATIEISTRLKRCHDFQEAFDFVVSAAPLVVVDGEGREGKPVASLSGVVCDTGYLPHEESNPYFDLFDSRDSHAHEAYHLIETEIERVVKLFGDKTHVEEFGGIIHLERAFVKEEHRGKGLTLRLMREARAVLGGFGRLAILKAHPDGENIKDADILRLASYYQQDRVCRFQAISQEAFPGWLVANWQDRGANETDQRWF